MTNIVYNRKIPPYQDIDFLWGIDPVNGDDPMTFILEKH